jgi:cyclophilin family peptidyl-prolyl cis-trans isomerase
VKFPPIVTIAGRIMKFPKRSLVVSVVLLGCMAPALASPVIDPIGNVSVPAGKSLTIPVTASSTNGLPLTYTVTSSTNRIAVELQTNNPFWKMSVVQLAASNAPGAFPTPFRGGVATVTNIGDMTFMLFRDRAPHTVDVVSGLTAGGFYNSNTIFHRVIPGFVIQGGDPLTNGLGGPVFRYNDEFHPRALFSGSGQLALANSGKDTDGSQFFVTLGPQRFLDLGYTIFGQLLRGFNVVSNVINTPRDANDRPLADVLITCASLVTNPTDTVITLTGTNLAGVAGSIRLMADDGLGGRATNTFTATTVTDTNSEAPILYPNTVTNLVAPVNKRLTNFVFGYDFPGVTNNWRVQYADANSSVSATNSSYIIITNQMQLFVMPNSNYAGPVSFIFFVSSSPAFTSYDQRTCTFALGDTAISAAATNFVTMPLSPFTNQLLATFTNGVPNSSPTNFTAFVNWGDNSTNSGVIVTNAGGRKEVRGSHTYTNSGSFPIYATITSKLGAEATVVSTATVPPALSLTRLAATNFIQWPAWAASFQPQSNTNLGGTNWTTLTNLSGLVGYENVVTNTTTSSNLFFRLKH